MIEGPIMDQTFSDAWDKTDGALIVKCHVLDGHRIVSWPEGYDLGLMDGTGAPQRIERIEPTPETFRFGDFPWFDLAWSVDGVKERGWRARWAMPRTRQVYLTLWTVDDTPIAPVPTFGKARRDGGIIFLSGRFTDRRKSIINIHGRSISDVLVRGVFLDVR